MSYMIKFLSIFASETKEPGNEKDCGDRCNR